MRDGREVSEHSPTLPPPTRPGYDDRTRRVRRNRHGDLTMVQNDHRLTVTRGRISDFLDLLARLRAASRPEELALVSGGWRAVERMKRENSEFGCATWGL